MTFPISKTPWNQGKLVGQKLPLKLEQIWAIRIRLEIANNIREHGLSLANFRVWIICGRAESESLTTSLLINTPVSSRSG